jgi:hypothetical protein
MKWGSRPAGRRLTRKLAVSMPTMATALVVNGAAFVQPPTTAPQRRGQWCAIALRPFTVAWFAAAFLRFARGIQKPFSRDALCVPNPSKKEGAATWAMFSY